MTVTNSTISGNTAITNGGGIFNQFGGTSTLTNSTVSGNTGDSRGGGIYNSSADISLINTIVAENTGSSRPDCSGNQTSLGHNLIGDDTGCVFTAATGDLVGDADNPIDPLLGPLQDNGGPTFTRGLLEGSPAIDTGDDSVLGPPHNLTIDQRGPGFPRLRGSHVDIGAFEFKSRTSPNAFDQTVTTTGERPVAIVLTASDLDTGDTLTFVIVSLPVDGDLFEGATVTGDKITSGDRVLAGTR